jgi:acylpyruvate hydrolase
MVPRPTWPSEIVIIMRIFCIGRNYAAHAAELGNELPGEPVVFMKPGTALVSEGETIVFPTHGNDLHHEAEIVIRIGKSGKNIPDVDAVTYISQIGVGIDLTLRDIQSQLKSKNLPWEKAKAFDGSAPLGEMVDFIDQDLTNIEIGCRVNGELRQQGNSSMMLFSIVEIISQLSRVWQLREGDLIYTGTPSGVGALHRGDRIEVFSSLTCPSSWKIL